MKVTLGTSYAAFRNPIGPCARGHRLPRHCSGAKAGLVISAVYAISRIDDSSCAYRDRALDDFRPFVLELLEQPPANQTLKAFRFGFAPKRVGQFQHSFDVLIEIVKISGRNPIFAMSRATNNVDFVPI
jgi:hypothetical protein